MHVGPDPIRPQAYTSPTPTRSPLRGSRSAGVAARAAASRVWMTYFSKTNMSGGQTKCPASTSNQTAVSYGCRTSFSERRSYCNLGSLKRVQVSNGRARAGGRGGRRGPRLHSHTATQSVHHLEASRPAAVAEIGNQCRPLDTLNRNTTPNSDSGVNTKQSLYFQSEL